MYGYAYAHGNVDAPFGLSTTYPRREIPLLGGTLKDVGLNSDTVLRLERDSVEFDPFTVFKEACEVGFTSAHMYVSILCVLV